MKTLTGTFLILLFSFPCFAQRIIAPLEYNPEQAQKSGSRFRLAAAGDTLKLPFFDDFTQSSVTPDDELWVPGGGTYINNNYAVNAINFNVATFDGLRENGTPYNAINTTARGIADNLTSRPIDLSVLNSGDSIYLRFYWQGQGYGEKPDAVDSLRLQLKNRNDVWKTVWKKTGDSTAFNHQLIRIGDSVQYYYKGFQFRFQSYGRLSGSYDVWNVDYVHLDTGRIAKDNWFPDISFTAPPTSYLKNYWAMPISQYLANKASETAATVSVNVTMLSNRQRTYKMEPAESYLSDIKNSVVFESTSSATNLFNESQVVTPLSSYWKADQTINYTPSPGLIPNTETPRILKYSFLQAISDPDSGSYYRYTVVADSIQSRINFRQNDTIAGYTYLTDYYAYDDGTAEFGFGLNQDLGKLAARYTLNAPDTLTHVDIYFPKIGVNQEAEPLVLTVWSSITPGTGNATVLYQESIGLMHSTALNKFQTYQLSTPLILPAGTFYVGYQQNTNEAIYTGFDKNTNRNSSIYYSLSGFWFQEADEAGSLMIRPVFKDATILGLTGKTYKELDCAVFPNPSIGTVSIAGKVSIMNLYDLSGRLILSSTYDGQTEDIRQEDLSFLPNGFYIMHLENDGAKAVKKIILNR